MADTSQAEQPPHTNGVSEDMDDEDKMKMRPADIDADVREMERRKRVESIMNSRLFREELERIIEIQLKDGSGTSGLMQQISDMMGGVSKNAGNVFKNSNCVVPINDIRGIGSIGYAKGEKILRCKLAAVYRLIDLYGWTQGAHTLITARLNQDEEHFLANPYGMLFHEMTASSLIKTDMQGNVVEQGTTNFGVNLCAYALNAAIHASRPDIKCVIHVATPSVVAISAVKCGLLPISQESVVIGEVSTHSCTGSLNDPDEREKIARNLGPNNKVLLLTNQGAVCCGETIEEAFFNARNTVLAAEAQLKLMPVGIDNLVLLSDEARKKIYDAARKAPESTPRPDQPSVLETKIERKWRVGGVEFEALMRMLDNAGFRTGYIYRHPLVKGDPPRPKNDVELPPAVSSLGYLLEEEELYKYGLWKKLEGGRKGLDRTRWLNSPNVYQKVEILETGTPDPKKITKWVADGSPTHSSTPVKIDSALQFVPKNTNPKEFKRLQQQIKDYRRADKISAGPQSQILEGVTWEEAKKMQDAGITQTGDQVVLMGAASKGIIQRGFQHNATMYKAPYARNPFDSITDEEIDEYKRVVERKTKGEYDTDYSESEGLSSAQINKRISDMRSPTSETEEESRDEPRVLRIETKHVPKPSQPEVVLSDVQLTTQSSYVDTADEVFYPPSHVTNTIADPGTNITSTPKRTAIVSMQSGLKAKAFASGASTGLKNYRTTSFFGFPKGSYCTPKPVHYHIVQDRGKPGLITRPKQVAKGQTEVSVNVQTNSQSVIHINIPMKALRDFITPFANALQLTETNTMASQTSFRKSSQNPAIDEFDNSLERSIMNKMHNNLLTDVFSSTLEHTDMHCSNELDTTSFLEVGIRETTLRRESVFSESGASGANDSGSFSDAVSQFAQKANNFIRENEQDAQEFVSGLMHNLLDKIFNLGESHESSLQETSSFCEYGPTPEKLLIVGSVLNRIPSSLVYYKDINPTKYLGSSSYSRFDTSFLNETRVENQSNTDTSPLKPRAEPCGYQHYRTSKPSENGHFMFMAQNIANLIETEADAGNDRNYCQPLENLRKPFIVPKISNMYSPLDDTRQMHTVGNTDNLSSEDLIHANDQYHTIDLMKHLADKSTAEVEKCMALFVNWAKSPGMDESDRKSTSPCISIAELYSSESITAPHESIALIVEDLVGRSIKEAEPNTPSSGIAEGTICAWSLRGLEQSDNTFEEESNFYPDFLNDNIRGVDTNSEDSGCEESVQSLALLKNKDAEENIHLAQKDDSNTSFYSAQMISDSTEFGTPEDDLLLYHNSKLEIVEQMTALITEYICKSCIQSENIILYPEVRNDEIAMTLIGKLENLFNEYFKHSLNSNEISEMRIDLADRIMHRICMDHHLDEERTFAISEFISNLLDFFFKSVVFSTPTSMNFANLDLAQATNNNNAMPLDEELAIFKVKQLNGNECYWFPVIKGDASQTQPQRKSLPEMQRPTFNVDDIPLKPPQELTYNYESNRLSPIPEIIPRKLIFDQEMNQTGTDDRFGESLLDEEPPEIYASVLELVDEDDTKSEEDALFTEELREIAMDFEDTTPNRFSQNVKLVRSDNSKEAFMSMTSISFAKRTSQGPENRSSQANEGNWMGYEHAKF